MKQLRINGIFNSENIAIAVSVAFMLPLCVAAWWMCNFLTFIFDGSTLPAWASFNQWISNLSV